VSAKPSNLSALAAPETTPAGPERRRRADDLWDAVDVARFLKTSRSWVYLRVERAEIPHLRVGGLIRFEPARIREWARSGLAAVERGSV
jgi:excisionase family DNA binding protein